MVLFLPASQYRIQSIWRLSRAAFEKLGFIEGKNVTFAYRWAAGHNDRFPALAGEFVAEPVDLIVAAGGTSSAVAAKNATLTIPVVFAAIGDPVGSGLVVAHPGGNVTGTSNLLGDLMSNRSGSSGHHPKMMDRYKSESEYNRQIVDSFKGSGDPEILIVVSKLLTGFDAPRNTVLYVCKPLREHNLLQAIARVNRLYEDDGQEKQFGFIIDYEGLLGELDKALTTYSAFEGFDSEDLAGSVHDVREEIRKLPQLHNQLWDIFNTIRNKRDMEQFEQFLADENQRHDFYDRLRAFSRCLHISLSSDKLFDVFSEEKIDAMKRDWKQFSELKRAVQLRYQETVDLQEFEPKIQKLLDDHVVAMPAETIIELVNINDPEALRAVVDEAGVSDASKADRIASATRRTITEKMEEDPALYRRFSEMLEQTIREYREKRISEKEYLNNIVDLASRVARRDHGSSVPPALASNEDAQAFYGLLQPALTRAGNGNAQEAATEIALKLIDIVKAHHIVGIWSNDIARNNIQNAIDDYFFDVVRDEKGIELPVDEIDKLESQIMDVARARFPA